MYRVKAGFCVVCVCVMCNLVAAHFTDMVNMAGKSEIDYNNSLRDLVVTKIYCKTHFF